MKVFFYELFGVFEYSVGGSPRSSNSDKEVVGISHVVEPLVASFLSCLILFVTGDSRFHSLLDFFSVQFASEASFGAGGSGFG